MTDTAGRFRFRVADSWAALDTIPARRRVWAVNVVGRLPGADASLVNEHILVDAHYDHIGAAGDPGSFCRPAGTDTNCNGADDA